MKGEVDSKLSDEIEGAVTTMVEAKNQEPGEKDEKPNVDKEDGEKNLPLDDADSNDEDSGNDDDDSLKEEGDGKSDDDAEESDEIKDEQVERAIKAGMTIAEARSFKDAKALDRICSILEKSAGGDSASEKQDENKDEEDEILKELDSITDLDPAEYDEKIVDGFKVMKGIIRKQHEIIGGLKRSAESGTEDWVDTRISGLGDGYKDAVGIGPSSGLNPNSAQAVKRADLKEKFEILSAGYQAARKDVSREAIFKEAVSLVLGDVEEVAKENDRKEKLAKRSSQHISRPNGAKTTPASDAFDEAAEDLDRKFFGKK